MKYKKALIKLQGNSSCQSNSSRQIWRQARQLKYDVQRDWFNQIITIYLTGQFNPVKSYHITSQVSFLFAALSHWYIHT